MGGLLPGRRQQAQRALVGGAAAHLALQPLHRFQVVVEAHRLRRQHQRQPPRLGRPALRLIAVAAPEIGRQHFDLHPRIPASHRRHRAREQTGAVIFEVVAGHGRQHHIAQLESTHRLGHPLGLGRIKGRRGLALIHLAKSTAARTHRPAQQKGGRAGRIALGPVGAAALLADGVQSLLTHHGLHPLQGGGIPHRPPQPLGQAFTGQLVAVAGLGLGHGRGGLFHGATALKGAGQGHLIGVLQLTTHR